MCTYFHKVKHDVDGSVTAPNPLPPPHEWDVCALPIYTPGWRETMWSSVLSLWRSSAPDHHISSSLCEAKNTISPNWLLCTMIMETTLGYEQEHTLIGSLLTGYELVSMNGEVSGLRTMWPFHVLRGFFLLIQTFLCCGCCFFSDKIFFFVDNYAPFCNTAAFLSLHL